MPKVNLMTHRTDPNALDDRHEEESIRTTDMDEKGGGKAIDDIIDKDVQHLALSQIQEIKESQHESKSSSIRQHSKSFMQSEKSM